MFFLRKVISKILVVLKINERTKTLVGRNNLGENTIKRKHEIILKNPALLDQIWTQIISTNYKNINVLKIYNEVFKDPLDPRNFSEFIYLI